MADLRLLRPRADPLAAVLGAMALAALAALAMLDRGSGGPCGSGPDLFAASAALAREIAGPGRMLAGCSAMAAAMAPMMLQPLRHVRTRSFADRRALLMATCAAAFLAAWTAWASMLEIAMPLPRPVAAGWLPSLAIAAAAIWQASPLKAKVLNRCHRRPALPAAMPSAAIAAAAYGLEAGCWCAASCLPVMALAEAAGCGHVVAMALAVPIALADRATPPRRPAWRWLPARLAAAWNGTARTLRRA